MAAKKACDFIEKNMSLSVKELGKEALINCAMTSMSSKLIGPESKIFSTLAVDAI